MQTLLDVHRRPVVIFDPKNVEHRRHMATFLKHGTWARSPVTFYAPENISVRAYALETMLDFYLRKEFAPARSGKLIAK